MGVFVKTINKQEISIQPSPLFGLKTEHMQPKKLHSMILTSIIFDNHSQGR